MPNSYCMPGLESYASAIGLAN